MWLLVGKRTNKQRPGSDNLSLSHTHTHTHRFVQSDHSKSLSALALLLTCMYTGELIMMTSILQTFSLFIVL